MSATDSVENQVPETQEHPSSLFPGDVKDGAFNVESILAAIADPDKAETKKFIEKQKEIIAFWSSNKGDLDEKADQRKEPLVPAGFHHKPVAGQGNCCFLSVALPLGLDGEVVRARLLESTQKASLHRLQESIPLLIENAPVEVDKEQLWERRDDIEYLRQHYVKVYGNSGQWGDAAILSFAGEALGVQIVLHRRGYEGTVALSEAGQYPRQVHLLHLGGHFDALVETLVPRNPKSTPVCLASGKYTAYGSAKLSVDGELKPWSAVQMSDGRAAVVLMFLSSKDSTVLQCLCAFQGELTDFTTDQHSQGVAVPTWAEPTFQLVSADDVVACYQVLKRRFVTDLMPLFGPGWQSKYARRRNSSKGRLLPRAVSLSVEPRASLRLLPHRALQTPRSNRAQE